MLYILLLCGLVIIYVAIRLNLSNEKSKEFSISENLYYEEINQIKDKIKEISNRLDDLENSLLIISDIYEKKEVENIEVTTDDTVEDAAEDNKEDINENRPFENKNINEIIYELYDQGIPVDDICSRLMIGKGEVLLRIGLRKQK